MPEENGQSSSSATPPRRFLGVELTWKLSASPGADLPRKANAYIFKATYAGGLSKKLVLELQDHFRAALAEGRSVDDIIKNLGNPYQLGAKLGRAASPLRWFFARLNIWLGRVLGSLILLYVLLWACLRWQEPAPTIDYYAKLNTQTQSTPADSHAWPIYRQALLDGRLHSPVISEVLYSRPYTAYDQIVQPGDENWPEAERYLNTLEPLLAVLRQGAQKPNLGCTFLPVHKLPHADQRALSDFPSGQLDPAPAYESDPASQLLIDQFDEKQLKQCAALRVAMIPILADMNLAAQSSDSARVLADFHTLLSVARQINQVPVATARYIAVQLFNDSTRRIAQLSLDYPTLFTDTQLGDIRRLIAHEMAHLDTLGPPLNYTFLDRLQRSYTTTEPGGRITYTGVGYLWKAMMTNAAPKQDPLPAREIAIMREISFPANYLMFPSVATLKAEQFQADAEYYRQSAKPWTRSTSFLPTLDFPEGLIDSARRLAHEYPRHMVGLESWSFTGILVAMAKAQARQDDALLALAQFHARHKRYPDSFQALVPEFLSSAPNAAVGEPLILKITPQGPLIYSVGPNGLDEGGLYIAPDGSRNPQAIPPGDEVHYPAHNKRVPHPTPTAQPSG